MYVKYLIEMFELNVDDVRSEDNFALRWSCEYGNNDVCMYLIDVGICFSSFSSTK